jgi:hypothetical protein
MVNHYLNNSPYPKENVITMKFLYVLIALLCAASIALVFTMRNLQTTNAIEVVSNVTSTICSADKSCVTTICINDEPCRSITSNSSSIQKDNSTEENKGNLDLRTI